MPLVLWDPFGLQERQNRDETFIGTRGNYYSFEQVGRDLEHLSEGIQDFIPPVDFGITYVENKTGIDVTSGEPICPEELESRKIVAATNFGFPLFDKIGDLFRWTKRGWSRPLTQADLGVEGYLTTLKGRIWRDGDVVFVRVDMIEGRIDNPFEILRKLGQDARRDGARVLRIEGTIANEKLYEILRKRYGLRSDGPKDTIELRLKPIR